jgi:hypothetical protein
VNDGVSASATPWEAGDAAARLIADLMPIAVAVAGPGADRLVAALSAAGAEAEVFAGGGESLADSLPAFDLTVLLAPAGEPAPALGATIAALASASDRLLFVPVSHEPTAAPDLGVWFELFADQGFQPVVDYDAGFLGAGAFLVDRNATAADSDLAEFAARVSVGGAPEESAVPPPPPPLTHAEADERIALREELAARTGELAASRAESNAWRARAMAAAGEADRLKRDMGAWDGLGRWIWAACGDPGRDTLAALRAAAGGSLGRRSWFARLRRRPGGPTKAERRLLEDAALIRKSRHFDAAWYIASHPDLAERGEDPVWHYVLRGAAAGAEPGPYFDSAPWRQRFPDRNPLAEAVRQGEGHPTIFQSG